jgi:hypothetical protein
MSDELLLQKVNPRTEKGRSLFIRSVPTLYLEDIAAIYTIMENYAKAGASGSVFTQINEALELGYKTRIEGYEALVKAKQQLGDAATFDLPHPPEPPDTREVSDPWVSIETDEFVLSNLSELESLKRDHIPHLRMSTWNPRIWLSCSPSGYYLSIDDNDPRTVEAFDQIRAIIEKRSNRLTRFIHSPIAALVVILLPGAVFAVIAWKHHDVAIFGWSSLVTPFIALGLFWFEGQLWNNRRGVVIPRKKVDAPPYWWRNSDTITTTVITAILTAILILVIGAIAGLF